MNGGDLVEDETKGGKEGNRRCQSLCLTTITEARCLSLLAWLSLGSGLLLGPAAAGLVVSLLLPEQGPLLPGCHPCGRLYVVPRERPLRQPRHGAWALLVSQPLACLEPACLLQRLLTHLHPTCRFVFRV